MKARNMGWAAVLAAGMMAAGAAQGAEGRPPNFVLIFMDDMGYADPGPFGPPAGPTPNLDRLATDGMRFTSFYAAQAVCSASRAALMSGCLPNRVGVLGALGPNAPAGLDPEEDTIADVLKRRGYACGIFGKWHLGDREPYLPLKQGFDEYLGLPYSNDMWPVDFDGTPIPPGQKRAQPGDGRPHRGYYVPLHLIDGNERVREIKTHRDQDDLTTLYTERAVKFIDANKARPFFLYLPHSMVHVPLGVSDKFRGKSGKGLFGDVMMEIDWSVGEVMAALKRNGLEDNTLVVFTSDNGPWLNYGHHAGSAGPLREGKGSMWEGGCRVPMIARWPGRVPAGTSCSRIAATVDILPTLAGLAGAALPQRKIDGVDIFPLLRGDAAANPRERYWYYYGQTLCAVREGKWKLQFPHMSRTYEGFEPGRDGFPGPTGNVKVGPALYDLEADIGERTNVAAQHADVVARLEAVAAEARADLGDAGKPGPGVRPPRKL
jgi:arylsulfatase